MIVSSLSSRNFGRIVAGGTDNTPNKPKGENPSRGKAAIWGFFAPILLAAGILALVAMALLAMYGGAAEILVIFTLILSLTVLSMVFMFRRFNTKRTPLLRSLILSTVFIGCFGTIEFFLLLEFMNTNGSFPIPLLDSIIKLIVELIVEFFHLLGLPDGSVLLIPFVFSLIAGIPTMIFILLKKPKKQKRTPANEEGYQ
jgi:hypothetical protein